MIGVVDLVSAIVMTMTGMAVLIATVIDMANKIVMDSSKEVVTRTMTDILISSRGVDMDAMTRIKILSGINNAAEANMMTDTEVLIALALMMTVVVLMIAPAAAHTMMMIAVAMTIVVAVMMTATVAAMTIVVAAMMIVTVNNASSLLILIGKLVLTRIPLQGNIRCNNKGICSNSRLNLIRIVICLQIIPSLTLISGIRRDLIAAVVVVHDLVAADMMTMIAGADLEVPALAASLVIATTERASSDSKFWVLMTTLCNRPIFPDLSGTSAIKG
jgi:hypothetical protein